MSDIKYSFFEEMREITDDPGWNSLLSEFSRGIFPQGITYHNRSIIKTSRYRKKLTYKLPESLDEALTKFQIIMRKSGYKTILDIESELTADLARKKKGWSGIRSEKLRAYHIKFYIASLAEQHDLSPVEEKKLSHYITISYILDEIDNANISLNNGHIEGITGLNWNSKTRSFLLEK